MRSWSASRNRRVVADSIALVRTPQISRTTTVTVVPADPTSWIRWIYLSWKSSAAPHYDSIPSGDNPEHGGMEVKTTIVIIEQAKLLKCTMVRYRSCRWKV